MKSQRVLIVASVASMIEQFNQGNIRILKELGYEVHVAANFEHGSSSSIESIQKFKNKLEDMDVKVFNIPFSRGLGTLSNNIKVISELKKLLETYSYQLVHCHSPIGGALTRLAAKKYPCKVIYTAHGFHFFKGASIKNWMIFYPIEYYLSKYTDALITINNEDFINAKKMKATDVYYLDGVGIDVPKIELVEPDACFKKKNKIAEDSIVLLSIGELNDNKNHALVIKALSQLPINYEYIIIGKGEKKVYLEELAKELKVSEKVHFMGFREDAISILKIADIFVFPSFREGLPVSVLEAMACNKYIVASKIRGNIDLLSDIKGASLFESNNEKELIKILSSLDRITISSVENDMLKYSEQVILEETKKIYQKYLEV